MLRLTVDFKKETVAGEDENLKLANLFEKLALDAKNGLLRHGCITNTDDVVIKYSSEEVREEEIAIVVEDGMVTSVYGKGLRPELEITILDKDSQDLDEVEEVSAEIDRIANDESYYEHY